MSPAFPVVMAHENVPARFTVRLSAIAPWLAGVAFGALLPVAAHATTFPWKSEFTDASSKEMAALHESIHAPHAEGLRAHAVTDLVWAEQDFKLEMKSGTLYLEPSIDGVNVGAFFEGNGIIHFTPSDVTARTSMQRNLAKERLEGVPVTTAYVFSTRPDSPLAPLASAAGGTSSAEEPRCLRGGQVGFATIGARPDGVVPESRRGRARRDLHHFPLGGDPEFRVPSKRGSSTPSTRRGRTPCVCAYSAMKRWST